MEPYFTTMFGDVGHDGSLILSITDPDILKQSKFINHMKNLFGKLALEKLQRQRMVTEYTALQILEYYFLFNK